MLPFLHVKPPGLVGVDICDYEIRLLHLRKVSDTFQIENFTIVPLPSHAVVDGKLKQSDVVLAAVSQAVRETKVQGCDAALALPASSVISKRIKLSKTIQPQEREAEIHANLKHYLPGIKDTLCLDFVELGLIDAELLEILLVATRLEQLQAYFNLVQSAGLVPKIIDVDCYAVARAVIFAAPQATKKAVAILDGGEKQIQLTVIQHKQVLLSQRWQVLERDALRAQLRRALQLCSTLHNQVVVNDVVLAGNLAQENFVHEPNFFLRIQAINPFQDMRFSNPMLQEKIINLLPRLLTCCGLALRSVPLC